MIYRVNLGDVQGENIDAGHVGYEYCATLREAKRAVAEIKREVRGDPDLWCGGAGPSFESRPTPRNKREVIALLNDWGSHREDT